MKCQTRKDTELNFSHVEPRTMFRRVVKMQAFQEAIGLSWRKGFIQGGGRVGIEIVQNEMDTSGVRLDAIDQEAHLVGEVLTSAAVSD